jgi:class 3 adenylate cyclase
LEAIGTRVGERLIPAWRERLRGGAISATSIEVKVGPRTFELLAVHRPDLGFLNVYGTDVTAARAVVKFPDQNPNPVFRLSWDGILVYANPASHQLIEGAGWTVDAPLPDPILEPLLAGARAGVRATIEVVSVDRRYRLLPVDVPEFGFINVYGTDVTAVHDLEAAYRENERLLLNILPEPVAERLRRGERPIADRFDDVSLLFADIVGFTSLSGGMGADELVSVLNEVFSVFDELVDVEGLEKVKTIGDAYMVVGGMSEDVPDHLERLARMALGLGTGVDRIETARHLGIQFRIGIHCGPVVAGVIGTRKFIYDVWGDTVNVASRMESTGLPRRIQVTAAVEERLRDGFLFEARGLTEIRGKGPMATFFLVGETPGVQVPVEERVRG